MQLDVITFGRSFASLSAAVQLAFTQQHLTVINAGEPRNRFAEYSHGFFGLDGLSPAQRRHRTCQPLQAYPTAILLAVM